MKRISDLNGLGVKSEKILATINIQTVEQLKDIGAVNTFYRLKKHAQSQGAYQPSLNFLYAIEGALTGKSWLEIAKTKKEDLLAELDSLEQMENLFSEDR